MASVKQSQNTLVQCLNCKAMMPYRTVDETAAGVTIQIPLRYCKSCHQAFMADLSQERVRSLSYAQNQISAVSPIFDAMRSISGGQNDPLCGFRF